MTELNIEPIVLRLDNTISSLVYKGCDKPEDKNESWSTLLLIQSADDDDDNEVDEFSTCADGENAAECVSEKLGVGL